MNKYFITSSLPYTNNVPHLGNLIGSTLSGDIYARFQRARGFETIYLCGTDDYGTTTASKAKQNGKSCQEICAEFHLLHKKIYDWFNIKFDVWGKTSTTNQTKITHEIFEGLMTNGFIEKRDMIQFYCKICDKNLVDRFVKGYCYHPKCLDHKILSNGDQCDFCQQLIDVSKLGDPFCNLCGDKNIQQIKSKHLFLKLDEMGPEIDAYLSKSNFPSNIASITNSWLNKGLNSRCITRDIEWGTPLPKSVVESDKEFENKVFYVWFDAPFGYYSILAEKMPDWREWLTSPNLKWVSTQAKDNIPFHTIMFPACVVGSEVKLPLIDSICGTEYLMFEGKKFSKSEGIGLFGDQVMKISEKLQINEDYWRFYLCKIRPETHDSNFSMADFVDTVSADLVNNIGNFMNRCLSFSLKNLNGSTSVKLRDPVKIKLQYFVKKYFEQMELFKFSNAVKTCLDLASFGNEYLQMEKPWELIKTYPEFVPSIVGNANIICYVLMQLLSPFIPGTISRMKEYVTSNISVFTDHNFENSTYSVEIVENYPLPFKKINLNDISSLIGNQ